MTVEELHFKMERSFSVNSVESIGSVQVRPGCSCACPGVSRQCYGAIKWPTESKGAVLVLVWSMLALGFRYDGAIASLVYYSSHTHGLSTENAAVLTAVIQAVTFMFYPAAGWIADVKLGRYRTIKYSLWLMWVGYLLGALIPSLNYAGKMAMDPGLFYTIVTIICLLITIGTAGVEANLLAFGTDQLVDGSSHSVSSFVHWQLWTGFMCLAAINYFLSCSTIPTSLFLVIQALVLSIGATLALSLDYICKDCLIVERVVTLDPYKTVTGVLRYAAMHKIPTRRSAFTYCYSNRPTRLDLAKLQYGGPFTTEQVEDVKTLLRILLVLVSMGGGTLLSSSIFHSLAPVGDHLYLNDTKSYHDVPQLHYCGRNPVLNNVYFGLGVLAVPIKELVVYPLYQKHFPTILKRAGTAMALQVLCVSVLFALNAIGYSSHPGQNTCFLHEHSASFEISRFWIILPQMLYGLAYIILFIAQYEFIVAQSPYNMKGLIIGLSYSIGGIATLIAKLLVLPFYHQHACGVWYFLTLFFFAIFQLVTFVLVAKRYKHRHRDDSTDIRMFAENYFGQ